LKQTLDAVASPVGPEPTQDPVTTSMLMWVCCRKCCVVAGPPTNCPETTSITATAGCCCSSAHLQNNRFVKPQTALILPASHTPVEALLTSTMMRCRMALERAASLPPLSSRPFPLRMARDAICTRRTRGAAQHHLKAENGTLKCPKV
jgi:hypothetical protein